MRRHRVLVAVVGAAFVVACTAVLGLPDVPPAQEDEAGSDGASPQTGSDAGVDGQSDATLASGSGDGAARGAEGAADVVCVGEACAPACRPDLSQCAGQQPQTCGPTGTWQDNGNACGPDQTCFGGLCTGQCGPAQVQCAGNVPQTCNGGAWQSGLACASPTPICADGGCVPLPSCRSGAAGAGVNCGPDAGADCCGCPLVSGGTCYRSCDHVSTDAGGLGCDYPSPAWVSNFRLDAFEVTVGRFRPFAAAVAGGWTPPENSGTHAYLIGDGGDGLENVGDAGGYEQGWDTSWNSNLTPTTPNLDCQPSYETWTDAPGPNENMPINCLNWYEAYAFCIWDGGFLPSESEWNFAAAGGSGYDGFRSFPWSASGTATIDCTYANYRGGPLEDGASETDYCVAPAFPTNVGSYSPKGDGKWAQSDLAGNVWEWLADWWAPYVTPCTDCANLAPPPMLGIPPSRVIRGGSFDFESLYQHTAQRLYGVPSTRGYNVGTRCARAP